MPYRELLTRPVLIWGAVAVGARLPVAMAPLALVFMVRERPGGYTLGALLAAVYVLGEILGAPVLGMRMRAERARPHLAAGLAVGAAAFLGLGLAHQASPVVLGGLALLAGIGPAATSGGLRAILTGMVPPEATARAMSLESVLMSGIWALAPALTTALALGVAPYVPLLLAGTLMAVAVAGLWALPAGWATDGAVGGSMVRALTRAWPLYVMGAAGLTLLAIAELVLPALLEQRSIGIGWAGPLLTGYAVGSALGAFVYGVRKWPGRLATQGEALLLTVTGCVVVVALTPWTGGIAFGLLLAGALAAASSLSRNLMLREVLPPHALAAGYSVMYAAVSAGYAASGTLSGALLSTVAPSTAVLAGVGLTLVLLLIGTLGERRMSPVADGAPGPEGAPVDAGRDAERSL
ncbi:MFS transporter [Streptomyces sp. SP18CS02]|uniref:MFS transporter n=1 Tax=Streptomyces sp. SP18CS02 TaxID=3002531 RepID=UPI002E7984EE|nr:MFS transporter [Streptomyces sp. SP18CS02]MEE1755758.1 MFS transporter [Streptomyces sp. SP18CS02]